MEELFMIAVTGELAVLILYTIYANRPMPKQPPVEKPDIAEIQKELEEDDVLQKISAITGRIDEFMNRGENDDR